MESHSKDPYRGIDLSQHRLDVIRLQSFLGYFWDHLKPLLEKKEKEPLKCLEVGCGYGVFAKMILNRIEEHRFPTSLEYTAIDPIHDCVERAKEMGINAIESDLFSFLDRKEADKYDIILFTKSLHHVLPVDLAIALASSHLKQNGIFITDECDRSLVDEETARWFFENVELLEASEVLHRKHSGHAHSHHHHEHHHHHHKHNHHHDHPKAETVPESQDHKYLSKFQAMVSKDLPPLATLTEIDQAIKHHFGCCLVTQKFPYMYNLFAPRLVNSEAGEKVLKSLMKIEEERIQNKHLAAIGVRIIATHHNT